MAAALIVGAALAVFVKTPGYSPIKTRLAATIGEEHALAFHRLAARAVMQVACATRDSGYNLQPYWAVAESAALQDPAWRELPILWQGDGGLGERLHHIYSALQARHRGVLLLGADAPQVTPDLLHTALRALQNPRTPFALGAACDGGFWLFGGRRRIARETWCAVTYAGEDTCRQLRHALGSPTAIAELPMLADVDSAPDLATVAKSLDVLPDPVPAQRELLDWLRARTVREIA